MMRRSCNKKGARIATVLAAAVAGLTALTGCGVPPDPSPRTIRASDVPSELRAPKRTWQIYVNKETRLVAIDRAIKLSADPLTTLRAALEGLRQPLTATEKSDGYESDLAKPENRVEVSQVSGRTVIVDLLDSNMDEDGPKLAQIVWTLTELPGIDRVDFVVHGVELPRRTVKGNSFADVPTPVSRAQYDLVRSEEAAKLYFVLNGKLTPVSRQVDAATPNEPTNEAADRYLLPLAIEGPTSKQQAQGYVSFVGDLTPKLFCDRAGSTAPCTYRIDIGRAFTSLTTTQQALAIGQILYTLEESWPLGSLQNVVIQVEGRPLLSVPTGRAPAARVDKSLYESLLA